MKNVDCKRFPPQHVFEKAKGHDAQEQMAIDAARYNFLRGRDLDTITKGGVFAGMTPRNVVLNGDDLDAAVDAAMLKTPNAKVTGAAHTGGSKNDNG